MMEWTSLINSSLCSNAMTAPRMLECVVIMLVLQAEAIAFVMPPHPLEVALEAVAAALGPILLLAPPARQGERPPAMPAFIQSRQAIAPPTLPPTLHAVEMHAKLVGPLLQHATPIPIATFPGRAFAYSHEDDKCPSPAASCSLRCLTLILSLHQHPLRCT